MEFEGRKWQGNNPSFRVAKTTGLVQTSTFRNAPADPFRVPVDGLNQEGSNHVARRVNYSFEKQKKENQRKQKKAEKLERKLAMKAEKEKAKEQNAPETPAPENEETPGGAEEQ
jgi:Skp family chaperone for outer membrane proteins